MNRQIEFRGKCIHTNKWIYGFLFIKEPPLVCLTECVKEEPRYYIIRTGFADWNMERPTSLFEVDPKTVGQFTGYFDKNKCKIFEDDIVSGNFSVKNSSDAYFHKELLNSNTRIIEFVDNSWVLIEPNLNRETQGIKIRKNTENRFTVIGNTIDGVENANN